MRLPDVFLLATLTAAALLALCQTATAQGSRRAEAAPADLTIVGRPAKCDGARVVLDRNLPNLGAAEPNVGLLILNPSLLSRMPDTVQLFVFHHECGHHHVGGNELAADCWAAERGIRDGWLDTRGIAEVCSSFGGMPETDTHPSGQRRCSNVNRCVAAATAEIAREKARTATKIGSAGAAAAPSKAPALLSEPRLLWSSRLMTNGR